MTLSRILKPLNVHRIMSDGDGGAGSIVVTDAFGGAASIASWTTRPITVAVVDDITDTSIDLDNNKVTLPAGTYDVDGYVMFWKGDSVHARLYDITNATTLLWGGAGYSSVSAALDRSSVRVPIKGRITLSGTADLRVEYYVGGASAELGNSAPDGSTVAVYLELKKV